MIATIKGTVTQKTADAVVVEAGGIGYEVFLTQTDLSKVSVGQTCSYFVYDHLREDAHNLYGFASLDAKQFFISLLGISGIGPKVALAVMTATSLDRLKQAIAAGDPAMLQGVAGVGKKTAERIVVELRGKVVASGTDVSSGDSAYQALLGLGFSAAQAADAVAGIPPSVTGEKERIKEALKLAGKR